MNKSIFTKLFLLSFLFLTYKATAVELVIGEKRVEPGIVFIFEGAIKDHVMPMSMHLSENQTNVHIEARVNWDEKNIPKGTPAGGFVPYLHITAQVINEKTKLSTFIDLLPHINLVDNFHYARNMSLPGDIKDPYTVIFKVTKPASIELSLHKDWLDTYGDALLKNGTFTYKKVNFEEIAKASRR